MERPDETRSQGPAIQLMKGDCFSRERSFSVRSASQEFRHLSSLAKVLPPCHHISIDRPVLERSVVKVKSKGGDEGIHIHSQIILRKDSHVPGIVHCTGQVILDERLSLLPGGL